MKVYGLIGKGLSHSFSKAYFENKFLNEMIIDSQYINFELQSIKQFSSLINSQPNISGLNVTIPYKIEIIPFLQNLDRSALEINAVNTIKIGKNREMIGYNTDFKAFQETIKPLISGKKLKALILGTGGASRAVETALKYENIEYQFVSTKNQHSDFLQYSALNEEIIHSFLLIINTSPVGMFPDSDDFPKIPYRYLTKNHILYDLIYNPEKSQFLKFGHEKGTIIKNGREMLELQAEMSWKIWNL